MAKTVLDASALLAFINREPGAEMVTAVLGEAAISTVNFSEVVTKLALRNRSPQRILDELTEFELEVVDFNRALAEDAGLLATATRGQGLSLGDRACLALARRENAVALTADNAWRQVQVDIEIQFIR
jgi:PIN domain nuclease of toxin-antitoxin system